MALTIRQDYILENIFISHDISVSLGLTFVADEKIFVPVKETEACNLNLNAIMKREGLSERCRRSVPQVKIKRHIHGLPNTSKKTKQVNDPKGKENIAEDITMPLNIVTQNARETEVTQCVDPQKQPNRAKLNSTQILNECINKNVMQLGNTRKSQSSPKGNISNGFEYSHDNLKFRNNFNKPTTSGDDNRSSERKAIRDRSFSCPNNSFWNDDTDNTTDEDLNDTSLEPHKPLVRSLSLHNLFLDDESPNEFCNNDDYQNESDSSEMNHSLIYENRKGNIIQPNVLNIPLENFELKKSNRSPEKPCARSSTSAFSDSESFSSPKKVKGFQTKTSDFNNYENHHLTMTSNATFGRNKQDYSYMVLCAPPSSKTISGTIIVRSPEKWSNRKEQDSRRSRKILNENKVINILDDSEAKSSMTSEGALVNTSTSVKEPNIECMDFCSTAGSGYNNSIPGSIFSRSPEKSRCSKTTSKDGKPHIFPKHSSKLNSHQWKKRASKSSCLNDSRPNFDAFSKPFKSRYTWNIFKKKSKQITISKSDEDIANLCDSNNLLPDSMSSSENVNVSKSDENVFVVSESDNLLPLSTAALAVSQEIENASLITCENYDSSGNHSLFSNAPVLNEPVEMPLKMKENYFGTSECESDNLISLVGESSGTVSNNASSSEIIEGYIFDFSKIKVPELETNDSLSSKQEPSSISLPGANGKDNSVSVSHQEASMTNQNANLISDAVDNFFKQLRIENDKNTI